MAGQLDAKLKALISSRSRIEAERELDQLNKKYLTAVINRVIKEELGGDMPTTFGALLDETDIFDDISAIVRGKISVRLLELWTENHPLNVGIHNGITSLHAYVVTATRNACVDYLRREYPGRHSLDNALRAVLSGRHDLKLWKIELNEREVEWRCGPVDRDSHEIIPMRLVSDSTLGMKLKQEIESLSKSEALTKIFEVCDSTLRYNDLLRFLCDAWDVERKYVEQTYPDIQFRAFDRSDSRKPEDIVELIGTIDSTWKQVAGLSQTQAAVLLFKAPPLDESTFFDMLVRFKIAGWHDIQSLLGIPIAHLKELASDSPLDDTKIAQILHIQFEDVPRIRQDARRRLDRQYRRRHRA